MRTKLSIANSSQSASVTVPRRCRRSTVPAKLPRVTRNSSGPPPRETTTSSSDRRPAAARTSISIRQSGGPGERNPLYRSRTTPATSGSRVTTAVRRPATAMLSSPTQDGSHDAPQPDGERNQARNDVGEGHDHPVAPARRPGIQALEPAAPLERDDLAEEVPPVNDIGERERIALGHEAIRFARDHAVQEEPPGRRLVTHDVADADSTFRCRRDERDITVPEERQHAATAGLDPQTLASPQRLGRELLGWTHARHLPERRVASIEHGG